MTVQNVEAGEDYAQGFADGAAAGRHRTAEPKRRIWLPTRAQYDRWAMRISFGSSIFCLGLFVGLVWR